MGLFSSLFGKKKEEQKETVASEPVVEKTEAPAAPVKEAPKAEAPKAEAKVEAPKTEAPAADTNTVKFTIDGKEVTGTLGGNLVDVAAENGVYIPTLCHMKDVIPAGSCRVCNVKVNGRCMAACTTPVSKDLDGVNVENDTPELADMRKAIIEIMFVEGNHFCPSCEKSGDCDLQAMGYKYQMMVPRFPYSFPQRETDASAPNIYLDRNRCILCKKCIRTVQVDGKNVFAFRSRGEKLEINMDTELAAKMNADEAKAAMDICPVGCILKKEVGFVNPIGTRKYDKTEIGTEQLN